MNKLHKYIYQEDDYMQAGGGYKSDKPVTQPRLSKLEIDKINQANQKRLFEEKQAQLSAKAIPTTDVVKNIGQKIDRDKKINSRQDKANLLGLALSPIPVIGEVYNSGNTIANTVVDLAQGEYGDALLSGGLYGLNKIPFNKLKSINQRNVKSNIFDSNGILSNFNPQNLKTEDGKEWIKKWYSSPEFIDRYKSTAKYDSKDMQDYILENLEKYEPKTYIDLAKDKGIKEYLNQSISSLGLSYGVPENIYINRTSRFPFNKKALESTKVHELTHLAEGNGYHLSNLDNKALLSPFNIADVKDIPKNNNIFTKEFLNHDPEYFLNPTEIHARMNQARFDLNLSPKDKFTDEMFNKIAKKNSWYGMGKYIKDKSKFTDLMNKFWTVTPLTVGAATLANQKQVGGNSNNLTIVEDGEYIRDNQGKVGKITNIPSHDDNELIIDNQIKSVSKGKGGQGIYNVESVLSASHENRNQSDNTYTQADEEIKIKPQDALQLAEQLNLKIKRPLSSISPSKLMDKLLESRESLVSKYKDIDKPLKSERQTNSFTANADVLNSIPTPEDIYNFVFSNQENSKSENNKMYAQTGKSKEYWENYDPASYQEGNFLPSHSIINPSITKKSLGYRVEGEFNPNTPDELLVSNQLPINELTLIHENKHRNNWLMKPGDYGIQNQILQKRMNTPPYNQFHYDRYGNPEEMSGYLEEINSQLPKNFSNKDLNKVLTDYPEVKNFMTNKNIGTYLSNKQQTGGRLQQFPTMYGNKPVALVNTSQGVKRVDMIDNRTVSMDDMFNKDSVQVQGNKAVIVKKNPLKKFIK